MPLLEVKQMTHFFGGLRAVHDYNLQVEPNQIRGLIGPNGAGKTTIFNLITGVYNPTEGDIVLGNETINGLQPFQIASRGLGRTFQNLRLWRHMTVLEHVKMARYSKIKYGLIGAFFDTPKRRKEEHEIEQLAYDLLDLVGIRHLVDQVVTNLPYGAQRRVMMDIIRRVHKEIGLAIFLIEHRMRVVMELCQIIQTLVFGEVIAEGTPDEIQSNPKVIDA